MDRFDIYEKNKEILEEESENTKAILDYLDKDPNNLEEEQEEENEDKNLFDETDKKIIIALLNYRNKEFFQKGKVHASFTAVTEEIYGDKSEKNTQNLMGRLIELQARTVLIKKGVQGIAITSVLDGLNISFENDSIIMSFSSGIETGVYRLLMNDIYKESFTQIKEKLSYDIFILLQEIRIKQFAFAELSHVYIAPSFSLRELGLSTEKKDYEKVSEALSNLKCEFNFIKNFAYSLGDCLLELDPLIESEIEELLNTKISFDGSLDDFMAGD